MFLFTRATRLRARFATAAALLVGTIAVAASAPAAAAAAGLQIPSRTTVTVSSGDTVPGPNGAVLPGGTSNADAEVVPGFLIGPRSSVSFTDTTNGTPLGTEPMPSSCFLHFGACQVSIQVDASSLANGANTITATYSGNFFLAASSGSAELDLESQTTTPDGTTTTQCAFACDTGQVASGDGTTTATISGAASPNATVTESFSTTGDPCSTPGGGDVLVFEAFGITTNKTIDLIVTGTAADTLNDLYFGNEHVCYESPVTFPVQDGTPPAQLDPVTGLYYGVLPPCEPSPSEEAGEGVNWNGTSLNPPCQDFSYFFLGGEDSPDIYDQQIETTAADPRASN